MSEVRSRTPEQRRAEIHARAVAMGVDEAFVSRLVDGFYERIRGDAVLGPVFNREIEDRWDVHLAKMKSFWGSVALGAEGYDGRPIPAHIKLQDLTPDDFERWMGMFHATLEELGASAEAMAFFLDRAGRISTSLQMAMFGNPELGLPPAGAWAKGSGNPGA